MYQPRPVPEHLGPPPPARGRVFYTSMGHREDVWQSDAFKSLLLGGLAWAVGDKPDVDLTANAAAVGK